MAFPKSCGTLNEARYGIFASIEFYYCTILNQILSPFNIVNRKQTHPCLILISILFMLGEG